MANTAVPNQSSLRSLSVYSADLAERPPMPELDRLARLASAALNVPIVLISALADQQQLIRSAIGLPMPWNTAALLPVSHAICTVVLATQPMASIGDVRSHAQLAEHLGIRDFEIRSYLGMRLEQADRQVLGYFCVADRVARYWTAEDISALQDLADLAAKQLGAAGPGAAGIGAGPAPRSERPASAGLERSAGSDFRRLLAQLRRYFRAYQQALVTVGEQNSASVVQSPLAAPDRPGLVFDLASVPAYLARLRKGQLLCVGDALGDHVLAPLHDQLRRAGAGSFMAAAIPFWATPPDQAQPGLALACVYTAGAHEWSASEQALLQQTIRQFAASVQAAQARQEQARAEAALLRSEATTGALLDAIPDLIFRMNRAGELLDFTALKDRKLFGPAATFSGQNVDQMLPAPLARQLLQYTLSALDSAKMEIFEYQLALSDGAEMAEYEARVVPSGADEVLAIVRDITERKRLEAQFLQIQKIESVGQLAGGIAHDFNNLLTAIIGYSDLAMMSLPEGSPALGDVEEIHRAADRAASLTRQLLSFARRQLMELRVVRLNDLIFDLYKLLRRLIGEDIELIMLPAASPSWVRVDPGQIEQVLVNLAVNGRDAMPYGGKLTIATANHHFNAEASRRYVGANAGEYVVLSISDTGIGMDAYVRAHLFEPFFTTKEKGRGTGLGLATCYGIIKQHGGLIDVESNVGQGARIDIYLPCVEADESSGHVYYDDTKGLPSGNETILLVEDEPAVRMLAARVLRGLGYLVIEAENGDEALSIARQRGHTRLDLLLTDVVMPRMSGKTLAERLTSAMPEVKVMFTSGYTNDPIMYQGAVDAGIAFLQKPFTPAILARKVREVLDS